MLPALIRNRRSPGFDVWSDEFAPLTRMFSGWDQESGFARGIDVDVREDGDRFLIEAELPGVDRDNVDITVENGVLTLSADHKADREDKGEGYYVRERRYGKVSRAFRLPENVDTENIGAELRNGVLTLSVPKAEAAKPRKIQVNVD